MSQSVHPYQRVSKKTSFIEIIYNNFIGGISWGLGATIGISLVFTLMGVLAQQVNLVPIVGSFASDVLNFILATNPNFRK